MNKEQKQFKLLIKSDLRIVERNWDSDDKADSAPGFSRAVNYSKSCVGFVSHFWAVPPVFPKAGIQGSCLFYGRRGERNVIL